MKYLATIILTITCAADAGEYVVSHKSAFISPPDMHIIKSLPLAKLHVVKMSEASARRLQKQGVQVSPNNKVYALRTRTSAVTTAGWHLTAVNSPAANAAGGNGDGITVCVVDTGIAPLPDLAPAITGGVNVIQGNPTDYADDNGHGTMVAALVAGRGTDRAQGVAPGASLYAVKVLQKNGSGTSADVAEGILHCIGNSQVINLSLGTFEDSQPISDAVDQALAQGILVVGAGGNDGDKDMSFPGRYGPVIGIGASTERGFKAAFSNYGPDLDFLAPGQDIETLQLDGSLKKMSGTSFSAGMASGVVAIHLSNKGKALVGRDLGLTPDVQGQGLLDAALSMQP